MKRVGRIETSAQSSFKDRDVDLRFGKMFHCQSGRDFEKRRMLLHGKVPQQRLYLRDEINNLRLGYQLAVNLDPLAKSHQVGRRE